MRRAWETNLSKVKGPGPGREGSPAAPTIPAAAGSNAPAPQRGIAPGIFQAAIQNARLAGNIFPKKPAADGSPRNPPGMVHPGIAKISFSAAAKRARNVANANADEFPRPKGAMSATVMKNFVVLAKKKREEMQRLAEA